MKERLLYIVFFVVQITSAQQTMPTVDFFLDKALDYHYINKDSAYYYYEKTIQLADQQNNLEYLAYSFQYLINANGHYYDLKNYQINLQREDSLLKNDKRFDTYINTQYFKDYLLFDTGNYFYKIKQYAIAKHYFIKFQNKIIAKSKNFRNKEDIALISSIYAFLGSIYRLTGKNELAEYTLKKDIALVIKYKDSIERWESNIYNTKILLSQVYSIKKEYKKANHLLKEALNFYKRKADDPSYKNNILSTFVSLTDNFVQQNMYKQALPTLKENSKFHPNDNPFEREVDLIYGDAYLGLKEYQKAEKYYLESLKKTKTYRNNLKHQDVATVYAHLGNLYLEQQQFEKGLQHYQFALIQLEKGFDNTNFNANPIPKNTTSKTELITILKDKQDALYIAYLNTNKLDYLHNAHQTSKAIIETLDELRPEFESKLDKQFLIDKTYPSIQKMVVIAYELYRKTAKDSYVDDAFFFMEKSKSIFLLEALRNAEATKYGQIPDDIINKEQQFRANISHLEQEIFNAKERNSSLSDSLYSLKNSYYSYLSNLEQEYPKYYDLKYNSSIIPLKTVQHKLQKSQAIISYLVSENELFITLIDATQKTILRLPYSNNLQKTINKLYRKSSKLNIKDTSIFDDSYTVYKAIFEPVIQKTKATDLIIIADDLLHYIAFDALVTSAKKPIYLLKTHSISYASSATLLQEHNKKARSSESKLLVFAPQFNGETIAYNQQRTDMAPLVYNQQEAQQIAQYFKGRTFSGNQASLQSFNNAVGKYSLLHFATHASANDEYPDYSYLAFSNDSTTSNLLYVKDIYNYQIDADLVTLSACQTGIGKLQKGEGMLSLARAFNYAGASSIVTTLWKIDDQSTSEIMDYFYKKLSEGLSKKEALRQAKLTYLEKNDDPLLNHPYYWSGIVLTGNTAPVVSNTYFWWILLIIGLGVLVLAYMLFIRKQKLDR